MDDKQYAFDVIKNENYLNYSYTKYISGIETVEGINLVMDETGMVYEINENFLIKTRDGKLAMFYSIDLTKEDGICEREFFKVIWE